jgi:anti-sigma regulatory factor (Ser/Thr protein kinase)
MHVRTFPGTPESVSDARAFIREHFTGPALQDALLLISEIAGNAVRHARGEYVVTVAEGPGVTRVQVRDGGGLGRVPRVREASETREGGRGLALVEAFASAWGTELHERGRTVWFDIAASAPVALAA